LVVSDERDLDRVFQLPPTTYIGGNEKSLPLREIVNRLKVGNETYMMLKRNDAKYNEISCPFLHL
jgi:hypothetical protein